MEGNSVLLREIVELKSEKAAMANQLEKRLQQQLAALEESV